MTDPETEVQETKQPETDVSKMLKQMQEQINDLSDSIKKKDTLLQKAEEDKKELVAEFDLLHKRHEILRENIPVQETEQHKMMDFFKNAGVTEGDLEKEHANNLSVIYNSLKID